MNPTERDPRIDPHPGDVLRTGGSYNWKYVEVLERDPRLAMNDVSCFSDGRENALSIGQWQTFAKTAEVMRVAREKK